MKEALIVAIIFGSLVLIPAIIGGTAAGNYQIIYNKVLIGMGIVKSDFDCITTVNASHNRGFCKN